MSEIADHHFLGRKLLLSEPRHGHRSGTDAVLLAAAVHLPTGGRLLDVGAGAGAAGLAALVRNPAATAVLMERDAEMARLAAHNIAANGLAHRAQAVCLDLFDKAACRRAGLEPADVVLSNPPFFLPGTVRPSPSAQKAASHVLSEGNHGDWFRRLLDLTAPGGDALVIHRPDALPALLEAAHGRAAIRMRAIHPKPNTMATRILVAAKLGSRAPLVVEPPLTLHDEDGRFTRVAEALHAGTCGFTNEKGLEDQPFSRGSQ